MIATGIVIRAVAAVMFFTVCVAAANDQPAEHVLRRDDLVVVIATATDRLESRYGPRFDRTAQILSVKVADEEWLAPDGMPDEFAQQGDGLLAYGRSGSPHFIKPGVGLLRADPTDGGGYFFAHPYAVEKRGIIQVSRGDDWLEARHEMPQAQGGQLVLSKLYRLLGRRELEVRFTLSLFDSKVQYSTTHYNHHFFRSGDKAPDDRYRVEFIGLPISWEARPRGFGIKGNEWLVSEAPSLGRANYVSLMPPIGSTSTDIVGAGFLLTLPGRGSVEFVAGGRATKAAVWAGQEGFCPELFVKVVVPPGGATSWTQHYRFLLSR